MDSDIPKNEPATPGPADEACLGTKQLTSGVPVPSSTPPVLPRGCVRDSERDIAAIDAALKSKRGKGHLGVLKASETRANFVCQSHLSLPFRARKSLPVESLCRLVAR